MKFSRRNSFASKKFKFTMANKCVIGLVSVCLLLSYYGIIKGSLAHIVAGLAIIVGIDFLRNGLSANQIDKLN